MSEQAAVHISCPQDVRLFDNQIIEIIDWHEIYKKIGQSEVLS